MPLSFAEEADSVAAIDLVNRFGEAGVRLAHERDRRNLHFLQADGQALPFRDGAFDWVFSHAVIEHVADAPNTCESARACCGRADGCICRPRPTCRLPARICLA